MYSASSALRCCPSYTPGPGVTITFGRPVAPDVAMAWAGFGTRSGKGAGDSPLAAARSSRREQRPLDAVPVGHDHIRIGDLEEAVALHGGRS